MSAPEAEKGKDYECDTPMNEEAAGSGQISVKKHKKSAPVPPDDFVVDRIKTLNGSPLP